MRQYIDDYIQSLENKLKMKSVKPEVIDELLIKIEFFNLS